MADNLEVKIEELTDAIRSLYQRPALSQSEINKLMTSLAQKFENSSDTATQRFIGVIVNETKKVLEEKQIEMRQQLTGFENLMKQMTQGIANSKMPMEVTKILNEVTDMYAKLGSQEIALQKINQTLIANKTANPINEIIKLSNEFAVFSRGFENITHTLNKNFSDFLNQVKSFNSKEELTDMQLELDTINGNINSIISALAIIDHKYRDLTGLIDSFNAKEAVFDQSLDSIKQLSDKFEIVKENVSNTATKDDAGELKERINYVSDSIAALGGNFDKTINITSQKLATAMNSIEAKLIKSLSSDENEKFKAELKASVDKISLQFSVDKEEILKKLQENYLQTITQADENLKNQIFEKVALLTTGINAINTQIDKVSEELSANVSQNSEKSIVVLTNFKAKLDLIEQNIKEFLKQSLLDEIKNTEENVKTITRDSLSSVVELFSSGFSNIESVLENKEAKMSQSFSVATDNFKNDIKTLSQELSKLREQVLSFNEENLEAVREPLKQVMEGLKNDTYAEQLSIINQNILDAAKNISDAFEPVKKELEDIKNDSVDEKLDIINQNILDTATSLNDSVNKTKVDLLNTLQGVNLQALNDIKSLSRLISNKIDEIKSDNANNVDDLKSYYHQVIEIVKDKVNELKTDENPLSEVKVDLQTMSNHIVESVENINLNISKEFEAYKQTIENFLDIQKNSEDGNSANEIKEALISIKNDLIEGILGTNKNAKSNFALLEEKINVLSENLEKITDKKDIIEAIEDASLKSNTDAVLDVSNSILNRVQNINNDDILAAISELSEKIQNNSNIETVLEAVNDISQRLQDEQNHEIIDVSNNILKQLQNNNNNSDIVEMLSEIAQKIQNDNAQNINNAIKDINEKLEDSNKQNIIEAVNNISEKIAHTNQQQIHNAKEIIEELQNAYSEITNKIDAFALQRENKEQVSDEDIIQKIVSINEKLELINVDKTDDIVDLIESLKEQTENTSRDFNEQLLDRINEVFEKNKEFINDEIINRYDKNNEEITSVGEYLSKINEYLTNVEYLKNNLSEDLKDCLETGIKELGEKFNYTFNKNADEMRGEAYTINDRIQNVEDNIDKIAQNISKIAGSNNDDSYAYSLQDVESDVAKLRLSVEKNLRGDNYKDFINRLIELKNINIENNKLNHSLENKMGSLNNWLKSTSQKLDGIAEQVASAHQMSMEEIKARLIRSEKSHDGNRFEEANKKQISYLEDLDEKLNLVIQKQNDAFDPTSFIDVTYENMRQTKELSERMDNIESKINKIQGYMEKIVAYIEE